MRKICRLLGLGVLGLALTVSVGSSGDKKKEKLPNLPTGWGKALMLSKEQSFKIRTLMAGYKAKIDDLNKKIDDLKAEEKAESVKLLTDEQKAILLKGLTGESKDKAKPAVDKAKDK